MELQVQFWHLSDLRLWRTGCVIYEKVINETQMPIALEHAYKEKSTILLILLPLRTIQKRTFQCETPCNQMN